MYQDLIPPECWNNPQYQSGLDLSKFDKEGDIYFYGWVMIELFTGIKIEKYEINYAMKIIKEMKINENNEQIIDEFKNLIFRCLNEVKYKRSKLLLIYFMLIYILK